MKVSELFEETAGQKAARLGAANQKRELAKAQRDAIKSYEADRRKQNKVETQVEKQQKEKNTLLAIERALESVFDGVDPGETLYRNLKKWFPEGLDMDYIDKLTNKEHRTKKGFYGLIADSWDDMQADKIFDAEQMVKTGKINNDYLDFDFVQIKDGKVIKMKNPWR